MKELITIDFLDKESTINSPSSSYQIFRQYFTRFIELTRAHVFVLNIFYVLYHGLFFPILNMEVFIYLSVILSATFSANLLDYSQHCCLSVTKYGTSICHHHKNLRGSTSISIFFASIVSIATITIAIVTSRISMTIRLKINIIKPASLIFIVGYF